MDPTQPVGVGLIGYGLFGRHHARAIASTPDAKLAAIAVKSPSSQAAAKEELGVPVTGDYRQLLADPDIQLIDIVVPNQLHFEVAEAALLAGKHVFLEKPMAIREADGRRLVELAAERQLLLAVNHELRLSSLWGGVKRLIDEGTIGSPLYALIELSRFPYRQGSEGWRYDIDRVGNWILEEPIHFFDLARWYLAGCGEPESVYACANGRDSERPELQDNFSALVRFGGGAYAVISQTLAAFEHHVTAKITGTQGTIWAYWSAPDARSERPRFGLRFGLGDQIEERQFDKPTGELLELADHLAAVVQSVRSGADCPCSGADGLWSTRLCLAAQQSVDLRRPVALSG